MFILYIPTVYSIQNITFNILYMQKYAKLFSYFMKINKIFIEIKNFINFNIFLFFKLI